MAVLGNDIRTLSEGEVGCDIEGILGVTRAPLEEEMTPMECKQWLRSGGLEVVDGGC